MLTKLKMRKTLTALAAAVLLLSCTIERSEGGKLDGYWQLTATDSLPAGPQADMHTSGVYWAVQAGMLLVRNVKRIELPPVIFQYQNTGQKLILSNPVADVREVGDSLLTDTTLLHHYGLGRLQDTLHIVVLDGDRMVLEREQVRLHFRKY